MEALKAGLIRAVRVGVAAAAGVGVHALLPALQASPYGLVAVPVVTALVSGLGKWMRLKWGLDTIPF